ncbi:MAG: methyltransferase domain-containing protein [Thermodesulfobacteriota bacterium]
MAEHDGYLATGFRDVDGNSDIGKLEACLRFMEGLSSFKAYKQVSIEKLRLKRGDTAMDLGCGLGFDVEKLANVVCPSGSSIGIDNSEKLLDAARTAFGHRKGVLFAQGDIHNLDIPANTVDGIRVDRTLQHVQDPQRVISEMVRVLKPGGWLVCAEPDWSTFVIDASNNEVPDAIVQTWKSSCRNPCIGRQLLKRVRAEGLENTWADGRILLTDGLKAADIVYDIYATAERVKVGNKEMSQAVDGWIDELQEREEREGVVACVTLFLVGGQKCK